MRTKPRPLATDHAILGACVRALGRLRAREGKLNPSFLAGHPFKDMTKIHIPSPLRQYAGQQADVAVKGSTVGDVLSDLVSRHPDLRRHLYTEDGKLRAFVNVYVNDEDIRYLKKEATAVTENDTVSIVPSVAGGNLG